MPWLVGTALIHSLAVTDKRGTFRNWTVLLAIMAFSLSLLGTFLVRSGVLVSVHAFATDPERGVFILAFLAIVIGISLGLFAWRAPRVGFGGDFSLFSRETLLLTGNVLLSVAAAMVLLGTLYPIAHQWATGANLSVGKPYFDLFFFLLMTPVVLIMGVGPILRWKRADAKEAIDRLRWALAVAILAALIVPPLMGGFSAIVPIGIFLAFWLMASTIANLVSRVRTLTSSDGVRAKLAKQPIHYYGMLLAHFGVGVFIIGVTLVEGYQEEKDVRMEIGDTVEMKGYTFRFDGAARVPGPNYMAERGTLTVTRAGVPYLVMHPEKRIYNVQQNPMTEAAIDSGFFRQMYVSMGEPLERGAWSVRLYYKPFVTWIWTGAALMALGGILALSDRRYRLAVKSLPESEPGAAAPKPRPAAASTSAAMEAKP